MFNIYPGNLTDAFFQTLCLAAWIGVPFIVWGLLLIFNRDATWRAKEVRAAKKNKVIQRTEQWDQRQITLGRVLVVVGSVALIVITLLVFSGYQELFEMMDAAAATATASP